MTRSNRKAWKRSYLLATVAVLLLLYFALVFIKNSINDINADLSGPYDVVRVVDGDTFITVIDGTETYIRLIGIDAPESVADETYKENTKEGAIASDYLKNILEGSTVFLEYDSEILDNYGRTLCYVYLNDEKTMVNELLIKNGYARTMTIKPNVKYEERLWIAENDAKREGNGFWGTGFFEK